MDVAQHRAFRDDDPDFEARKYHVVGISHAGERELEKAAIQLSSRQVDEILLAASDAGNMSLPLSGLGDVPEALAADPERLRDRLSGSLLIGLLALVCFPADRTYLRVVELARLLGMPPSKLRRNISTLAWVGLVGALRRPLTLQAGAMSRPATLPVAPVPGGLGGVWPCL